MSTPWRGCWVRVEQVPGHWGEHEGLFTFALVFHHQLGSKRQLLVLLVKEQSPSGHRVLLGGRPCTHGL